MDKAKYNEAKAVLEEITQALKAGKLSEEEKQNFEILKAQLSGQLLSIWWPFDWVRRCIMIVLFLVGLSGLIVGNNYLLLAWLVLLIFSPRVVGEVSFLMGRVLR